MICGIGTDMIEIRRVEEACGRESFSDYSFTAEERRQSRGRASFLAGCFTVKEAVSKCFGTGFSGFGPSDIEVLRDERGKPYVNLYGKAKDLFEEMGGVRILVSISDTADYAVGFAVLEGKDH